MRVMVVGGGGREHAIIKKLKENPTIRQIYALPGNGGIAGDAICVNIGAKDIQDIVLFAIDNKIDYAVVAPDDPLVLGAVDALSRAGIDCFGPVAKAAEIEGSKVFAKDLMKIYGIPTAAYEVFDSSAKALAYIESVDMPRFIKADGLALGKGAILARTKEEARAIIRSIMEEKIFGTSGNRIVIEEVMTGPEVSVLAFTDGKTVVPMVSSMDHKRAHDNDEGPNTGGMGTIAPNPYYTDEIAERCMQTIFLPTIRAMQKEGREFRGCLYFGLMLTPEGPKVVEYNCRFGDPEAQVVMPLLETDLFTIMRAVTEGRLSDVEVKFKKGYSCCVVMASAGYPQKYQTGYPISIDESVADSVYVAGAKLSADGRQLLTSGGRVLGVVHIADTLDEAIKGAYDKVAKIKFANEYHRSDIGKRALLALK
ncbi:MAG: phosphoribosylamine--glycine ligase [Eubacteriales bacterium]|jgi:phosphoribosylamine--glycine ligase